MGKNIFYYEYQKILLINEGRTEIPEGKMSKTRFPLKISDRLRVFSGRLCRKDRTRVYLGRLIVSVARIFLSDR